MKHISKKYTIDQLREAVAGSYSIKQVLEKIGLVCSGGNHYHLKGKLKAFGIDTSHFLGQAARKKLDKTWSPPTKRSLEEILKEGTTCNTHSLKKRLIESGLLKEECYECGQDKYWNKKPLALQLDHINGIRTDNRIDNLRILCPNCHSQTETFSGKNAVKK